MSDPNRNRYVTDRNATGPNANTNTGTSIPKGMGAEAPTTRKGREGYEVVQTVMRYCRDHSIPEPDRIARSALGQQTVNLLRGGYDERDIRATALDLAARFTLYARHKALMTLQQTVQQTYLDRQHAEHEAHKKAGRPVAPDVAKAMGMPLKGFTGTHSEYDPSWTRRCATPNCPRTALFSRDHCGAHEP